MGGRERERCHKYHIPILDEPLSAFSFSLRVRAFTLEAATCGRARAYAVITLYAL